MAHLDHTRTTLTGLMLGMFLSSYPAGASDLMDNADLGTISELGLSMRTMPIAAPTGQQADVIQTGEANRAVLEQSGQSLLGRIVQQGSDQEAYILQNGVDLLAEIVQQGDGNRAGITQSGYDNQAQIAQIGSYNNASVEQSGAGLRNSVTQYGNGQRIDIRQYR